MPEVHGLAEDPNKITVGKIVDVCAWLFGFVPMFDEQCRLIGKSVGLLTHRLEYNEVFAGRLDPYAEDPTTRLKRFDNAPLPWLEVEEYEVPSTLTSKNDQAV